MCVKNVVLYWIAYTNDLPKLIKAIELSLMVISAWDKDKLVGLIRVVGMD